MTITEQIRRIYERRPYPAAAGRGWSRRSKSLPPCQWMQAVGRPGEPAPRRVLVAGCGTGAEAFALRRAFPAAELVGVDFSPRSIAIARRLQETCRLERSIRFVGADLADASLVDKTGGHFDLISCHGVLSYVPNPGRALAHLADCLQPGGVLYLGVNGDAHPAKRLRRWLVRFGLQVDVLRDERRLRKLLRLWDALHPGPGPALAGLPASYLAGDVCGVQFNNWSLARWRNTAGRVGWRIAGAWQLPTLLRATLEGATHRPLFPASVGELLARLDAAAPASFHRLLLRRAADAQGDWDGAGDSRECEVCWTGLYSLQLRSTRSTRTPLAILRCPLFNLRLDWPVEARQGAAVASLAQSPGQWVPWPPAWGRAEAARRTLWLWMGFGVVAVRPKVFLPAQVRQ